MTVDTIYLGHNNTVDLILKVDNAAYALTSVTRITATFGDNLVTSSDKANGAITWDQVGYDTGEIRIAAGFQSLTASRKPYSVPIVVYDASNTNGIVWGEYKILVTGELEVTLASASESPSESPSPSPSP